MASCESTCQKKQIRKSEIRGLLTPAVRDASDVEFVDPDNINQTWLMPKLLIQVI